MKVDQSKNPLGIYSLGFGACKQSLDQVDIIGCKIAGCWLGPNPQWEPYEVCLTFDFLHKSANVKKMHHILQLGECNNFCKFCIIQLRNIF